MRASPREALPERGLIRVQCSTETTPGWDGLLIDRSGAQEIVKSGEFLWKLQPGMNRLAVRTRNSAGRAGPPENIVLELAE